VLKLYSNTICPFAHRCRLAVALKGLDHERVEVDLAEMPDWYRKLSPNQKVPLLEHNGNKVWESSIINEYLEDAFPETPLLSGDPLLRARARLSIDFTGQNLVPNFYKVLQDSDPQALERIQKAIHDMAEWMDADGPFWLGGAPGLADIAIYPWFERMLVLDHYRNYQPNYGKRVEQWLEPMRTPPAVLAETGNPQAFVKAYARYANSK